MLQASLFDPPAAPIFTMPDKIEQKYPSVKVVIDKILNVKKKQPQTLTTRRHRIFTTGAGMV